jgi:lipoprotein-releasing system ATP-binding protein
MLEARNIHKTFTSGNKEIQVLKGVDLKIDEGRFIAVAGPSGAGKSTLLHILGGLDAPQKGEVAFQGQNLYTLKDTALCRIRSRSIGFVFQFYHLLPEFTVLENVMMPGLIAGNGKAGAGNRIREKGATLLQQVGLSERVGHFPSQLSGGEKQRVAIARALMNDPLVLLCDEPTGNLDSGTGGEIMAAIKKISVEKKMAVVLVTHNLELASLANAVYHLKDGVLVH